MMNANASNASKRSSMWLDFCPLESLACASGASVAALVDLLVEKSPGPVVDCRNVAEAVTVGFGLSSALPPPGLPAGKKTVVVTKPDWSGFWGAVAVAN